MFHQTSTTGSHDNLSLDNIVSYSEGNNSKENGSFLELMESMGSPAVNISSQISMTEDNIDAGKLKGSEIRKNNNKGRYAFQTRSQVDILDDGYRWRKYGQKSVKNSKFPRSYYRCTNGGCKVKKQVQRLSKDEGVVVTTYEGMHSHPIEKSSDNFEHILTQMQIYPTS